MAELIFPHTLEYPDNHDITLSEIAATLVAHERLMPLAAEILERLYPGLTVEKVRINLEYARQGSLQEAFFIAILATYQKDLDKALPVMIEQLTGLQVPEEYKPILSVLFIVLLYFGVKGLLAKIQKKGSDGKDATPNVSGDYNTIINIASGSLNVRPEELEAAVQATATPKRRGVLSRVAIDLFRPAKRGGNGRIVVGGAPEISRETVAEFPDAIALAELDEDTEIESHANAVLEVRATDRDRAETGWAGKLHVGSMSTSRLSLKLSPEVDREALSKRERVRVEAMVESRRLDDDTLKALRIHVLRVIDDAPNASG